MACLQLAISGGVLYHANHVDLISATQNLHCEAAVADVRCRLAEGGIKALQSHGALYLAHVDGIGHNERKLRCGIIISLLLMGLVNLLREISMPWERAARRKNAS